MEFCFGYKSLIFFIHLAPLHGRSAGRHIPHHKKYLHIFPSAILKMAPLALDKARVGHGVSTSGVRDSSLAWSEKKLMNHPGPCWQNMVFTPIPGKKMSNTIPSLHHTHIKGKLKIFMNVLLSGFTGYAFFHFKNMKTPFLTITLIFLHSRLPSIQVKELSYLKSLQTK